MAPGNEAGDHVEVITETDLDVHEAWAAVTDWTEHTVGVPFTTMRVERAGQAPGLGDRLIATTVVGPVRVVDPMEVTHWQPPTGKRPGLAVITKTGEQVLGGATVEVEALGARAVVRWREDARPGPRLFGGALRLVPGGMRRLVTAWTFGRALRGVLSRAEARDLAERRRQ